MRYTGPKARLCRREGVNLFGPEKYTKITQRRASAPGVHGSARGKKLSEFGNQMREKQKAKRMYGVSEKQFQRYVSRATRSKSTTGNRLLQLLELRLDNVIYRAGFARTRMQARQFVTHGHLLINGKKVDIPSIEISVGDVVSLHERIFDSPYLSDIASLQKFAPKWLQIDVKKKTITISRLPEDDELEMAIAVHRIIEFYSR
ncbi:30S ribosomal protein S4 [Candidatus Peregrinibacteria bacterium]|nr:MAG: 30S ribosomal protein S4 [Candidatus Peregrinibacteria bacterium]